MREGRGKYTWANGDSYEGNWDNGEQSGRGRYRYAIDDVYEGNWAHGRKNGRGYLFVKTEGKVFFEIWKNGHIAKHEELDPHQPDTWPSLDEADDEAPGARRRNGSASSVADAASARVNDDVAAVTYRVAGWSTGMLGAVGRRKMVI